MVKSAATDLIREVCSMPLGIFLFFRLSFSCLLMGRRLNLKMAHSESPSE